MVTYILLGFQIVSQFRTGRISPKDICDVCLRRIKAIQELNAFVTVTEPEARTQATASQDRYGKGPTAYLPDSV